MAATNYTPIQLYYSTTASAAPTAGNLVNGELAINITDGKLYYKDNGGVVQVIATKGAGTIGGSNTQIQFNDGGALAGNAAMVFNKATNVTTLTTLNLTNALGATYGGTAQSAYAQGDLLYASAVNTLSKLSIGTVNYILTSTGSVPQWVAPTSVTVQTANNLAGGAAGSVPYQSAADTTTFLAIGAANRVMTSTGSAPQWVTSLTGLTGVSSSSMTNTSLTSGRVVYSGASGVQTDSANLTFNGTTLSAGGFSTTGNSTLVKLVTIGDSGFTTGAVLAAATPAKLYIGTGAVTDGSSAGGATNTLGTITAFDQTQVIATNANVTYTNLATLYIAGAPTAGTNVTITNPYAFYVAGGASYFGGAVTYGAGLTLGGNLLFSPDNTYDIGASGATRARNFYLAGNEVIGGTSGIAGTLFKPEGSFIQWNSTGASGGTNRAIVWADSSSNLYLGTGSGNSTVVTFSSAGNTAFGGVTPSSWAATYNAVQFGYSTTRASALFTNGVDDTWFASNAYFNGTNWVKFASGTASAYEMYGGAHKWYTYATVGTGTFSFSNPMTLTNAGDLVLGSTASLSTQPNRTDFTINGSSNTIISFGVGGVRKGYLYCMPDIILTAEGGSLTLQSTTSQSIYSSTSSTVRSEIDGAGRVGWGTQGTTGDRFLDMSFQGVTLDAGSNQFGQVLNPTYSTGVTSTIFNLYSGPNLTSGTSLANVYNLYLEAINATGSTISGSKWGVYQAGSGDRNYFAGMVQIGTTTTPTNSGAGTLGVSNCLYVGQQTQNINYGNGISFGAVACGLLLQQSVNTNDERVYLTNNAQTSTTSGFTGNFVYNKTGAAATAYSSSGGYVQFYGADVGTAGAAITWTNLFAVKKDETFALQGASNSSGTGITFPGTQNASSNANTLDDYEEGTFTPTLSFGGSSTGITYSYQNGLYIKVGRLVFVRVGIVITNKGSGSGVAKFSGFPFTVESISYADAVGPTSFGGMTGLTSPINIVMNNGSTEAQFRQFNSTTEANLTDAQFTNSSYIYGSFCYNVA